MAQPLERIPVPWPQRWELLRERVLPVACFLATLVACAWLWRHQSTVTPAAIGEVRRRTVVVSSPCDGELLPAEERGVAPPLFTKVEKGAVAARVRDATEADRIVEVPAPLSGSMVSMAANPGEFVKAGDPLLTIASPQPEYIVCHVPDLGQAPPAVGATVAIRRQGRGARARWISTVVEAVGPGMEPPPPFQNGTARALPIRIALPENLELTPGSLVDVRFSPASL